MRNVVCNYKMSYYREKGLLKKEKKKNKKKIKNNLSKIGTRRVINAKQYKKVSVH